MKNLELKNVSFKYEDANGKIHVVDMDEIVHELGFEYSIPDNVLKLTDYHKMIEIKINGVIIFKTN